jgi:hypothetical protein
MNYTHLLSELNKATAFDLYRLSVAIGRELDNPQRTLAIKRKLHVGMEVSYFSDSQNKLVKAKILEMRQKRVLVLELESNHRISFPYYFINIEHIDTDIYASSKKESLTANTLKVGDCVGFTAKDGKAIMGIILRLNQKTVTLKTNTGVEWRVGYYWLFRILDAEIAKEFSSLQQSQGL